MARPTVPPARRRTRSRARRTGWRTRSTTPATGAEPPGADGAPGATCARRTVASRPVLRAEQPLERLQRLVDHVGLVRRPVPALGVCDAVADVLVEQAQ